MKMRGLKTFVVCSTVLGSSIAMTEEKKTGCCGLRFTSTKCECPDGKPTSCPCATCSRDKSCACVSALSKGKGVVRGKVENKYVRKYATVVYIEDMRGASFAPPARPVVMDQKGKTFKPKVLPVVVGTKVEFLNSDDFEHNVFSPDGEKYNLGKWKKGDKRSYTFKRAGAYVQLCSIHPEMMGYVFVAKTPYFAVVKEDGSFEIPNVPPGEWKLKVWNERFRKKSLDKTFDVEVEEGKAAEVEVKP